MTLQELMEYFINTYIEPMFKKIDDFIENLIENNCMTNNYNFDNSNNTIIDINNDNSEKELSGKDKEWDIIENNETDNV